METLLKAVFACLILAIFCNGQEVNVALNRTTSQLDDLDWSDFLWTSDKAVDGCTNGSLPDTNQCCSSSNAGVGNFWKVELDMEYSVNRIVIYGRTDDVGAQLQDFQVYVKNATGELEMIYDNTGVDYGDAVFTIDVNSTLVQTVEIRRDGRSLTLCEVEVYADIPLVTTPDPDGDGSGNGRAQRITTAAILYPIATIAAAVWYNKLV